MPHLKIRQPSAQKQPQIAQPVHIIEHQLAQQLEAGQVQHTRLQQAASQRQALKFCYPLQDALQARDCIHAVHVPVEADGDESAPV